MQGALSYAIVAFLLWSAASFLWSDEPGMTLRKVAALACLATGALGVSRLLSWRQLIMLVFASASIQLLLGLAAEIAMGTFRPLAGGYQYTGLGYQAFTAWTMSLLVLAGLALRSWVAKSWGPWLAGLMIAATVLLLLAKSRTPAVAFVLAVLTYLALRWPVRRVVYSAVFAGLLGSLALLVIDSFSGDVLGAVSDVVNLGREKESIGNLTGRTEIWAELMPYIEARPLVGYGYESFWTAPRLIDFNSSQGWAVPDAHNGFINFALGIGVPGSLLYACILVLATARAVRRCTASGHVEYAFVAAALVGQSINMLCVAIQMSPYFPCMVAMFLLAKLAFVEDAASDFTPAQAAGGPAAAGGASIAVETSPFPSEPPQ
jgi:O-antigen ligase